MGEMIHRRKHAALFTLYRREHEEFRQQLGDIRPPDRMFPGDTYDSLWNRLERNLA